MKTTFSVYDDVNRLLKAAGWEHPEKVPDEIRFEEAMRVLLKVPMVGPKGYPNAES